jgi:hypothetical protein
MPSTHPRTLTHPVSKLPYMIALSYSLGHRAHPITRPRLCWQPYSSIVPSSLSFQSSPVSHFNTPVSSVSPSLPSSTLCEIERLRQSFPAVPSPSPSRSSPVSYLITPVSSVSSSPPPSTLCEIERPPTQQSLPALPKSNKDMQPRDSQRDKHVMGLIGQYRFCRCIFQSLNDPAHRLYFCLADQAVKSLCEVWYHQDIPSVFLTSRRRIPPTTSQPVHRASHHRRQFFPSHKVIPSTENLQTRESAFRNVKSIAECLADELINAAKGSSNLYAIKVWSLYPYIYILTIFSSEKRRGGVAKSNR